MNTITDKELRKRIKALSRNELEECVADICIYLYGKCEDEDGNPTPPHAEYLFDGAPCDSGEELDMAQNCGAILSLVEP